MKHSAQALLLWSTAACVALPPVVARLPEVTFHATDPKLGVRGMLVWKECSARVTEILGIDSRWQGRVVFLPREIQGSSWASFEPPGTILVGAESQASEQDLVFVLAHELTHALARGQWLESLPFALQEGVASWVGGVVSNQPAVPGDWCPRTQEVRRMLLLSCDDFARAQDQVYLERVATWYVEELGLDYVRERGRSGLAFQVPRARYKLTHYGFDGAVLTEDLADTLPVGGSTPEGTLRTEVALVFVPGELALPDPGTVQATSLGCRCGSRRSPP